MRRGLKWLAWIAAGLFGIIVLLVALLFFANNTGTGQRMLGRILSGATGGSVTSSGDPFWSPTHLHFDNLQLHDKQGVYLRLHDITIDWSILGLFHGRAQVNKLTVGKATLERLPGSLSQTKATSKKGSSGLPVTVVLHQLIVDKLVLAPAVAGKEYDLKLTGSGTLDSYTQGKGQLTATEIGGPAVYKLDANVGPKQIKLDVSAHEPPQGLIASLAKLPQLGGGISIDASLDGPRDAVATKLAAQAGKLTANANGTLNLVNEGANLTVNAQAPAMQPRQGLSWQSVALQAQVQGSFTKPTVNGHLAIDKLVAYGGGASQLTATVSGDQGLVHVQAQADGLKVPGSQPDIMAGAPLKVNATVHLAQADRPVEFTVQHPLIQAQGVAQTAQTLAAKLHLTIPQLQPFAAVAGAKLQGHTALDISGSEQNGTTHVAVNGTIGLDSGVKPAPSLIGNDAHIDTAVDLHGRDITIQKFTLNGQDARASVQGSVVGGKVALDWAAAVSNLAAIQPTLGGQVQAKGHVGGTTQNLALAADVNGSVATKGMNSGQFTAHLQAQGLPSAPAGTLAVQGSLLDAPVQLAVAAQKLPNGAYHLAINQAQWKSAHAGGELTVNPPAVVPQGQLTLAMGQLSDLDPLLGRHLTGSLSATLDATASQAHLVTRVQNVSVPGTASVSRVDLDLAIDNPTTQPVINGALALDGFSMHGIAGSAKLHAQGPEQALALRVGASLPKLYGGAAKLDSTALLNVPGKAVRLDTLQAAWKQLALRLQQPAQIEQLAGGDIGVHDLRLAVDRGLVAVNGTVGKALNLDASIRDLPASIAAVVDPKLAASGTINAQAHLTGTTSNPLGTVKLQARALQVQTGKKGGRTPPASLTADVALHGTEAQVQAHMTVDRGVLTAHGTVGKTLDLTADLRNLPASIIEAVQPKTKASGTISAQAHLTGALSKPNGTVRVQARRIQLRTGPGEAMPPATLIASADLQAGQARVDARLDVGRSRLTLAGTAPVMGGGSIDLRTNGSVDLTMLDPLLAANGRRVAGQLVVDARITGPETKPLVAGTARLLHGDVQDYTYGVHLRDITATLQGNGENLRLTRFTALAGPGRLGGSGTIGLAAPMPVNLVFTAHDATPIANDILTERLDANLAIVGDVQGNLAVRGDVSVLHADIQIPDKLPHSVAVIPVVNPNAPPAPPKKPGPAMNVVLNLTIRAREVFVRGHGLDADLAGLMRVRGTSANPLPSGGLTLQRGTFSLAGQSLTFTEGTVDFIGAGISDPALHFVATTTANNITATLTIGGTVHRLKISLSSVPELPQDEILAQILFHRSISQLSPFEVAQVAAAVASFTGVSSGLDPLASLRKSLGLDRLSVGTNAQGSPTVQAGRYLAPGIYLGAKQNATGAGTQAELQIDITKGLKLDTTAGASAMSATGAAGSGQAASVGVTYQFQY